MENQAFIERINLCISNSHSTQTAIAEYCEVSNQSVTNWKRNGQISRGNLKRLSEITGYRYLWLLKGTGPERFTDPDENDREFRIAEEQELYGLASEDKSPATRKLLNSLTFALANKHLDEKSIQLLADFVASLGPGGQDR